MLCSTEGCSESGAWIYRPEGGNVLSILCNADTETLMAYGEPGEAFTSLPTKTSSKVITP